MSSSELLDLKQPRSASMNGKASSCLNFPRTGALFKNSSTLVGVMNVLRIVWIARFERVGGRGGTITYKCKGAQCEGYFKYIKAEDSSKCKVTESVPCTCSHSVVCKEPMHTIWSTHNAWKQAVIFYYVVSKSYDIINAIPAKHERIKRMAGLLCKKKSGEWVEAWAERNCKINGPATFKIQMIDIPCPPPASLEKKSLVDSTEETTKMNVIISPKVHTDNNHSGLFDAAVYECQICYEETPNNELFRLKCACVDANCHLCFGCFCAVVGSRKAQPMDLGYAFAAIRTTDSATCPFCNEPTKQYRPLVGSRSWALCAVNFGWYYDRPIVHQVEYKKFEKFFKAKLLADCTAARDAQEDVDSSRVRLDNLRQMMEEQRRLLELAGAEEPVELNEKRAMESRMVGELETLKQNSVKLIGVLPSWLKDKTGAIVELPYEELEAFNKDQEKQRKMAEENNVVTVRARMEARQARADNRASRAYDRDGNPQHIVELLSDESDGDDASFVPPGGHYTGSLRR